MNGLKSDNNNEEKKAVDKAALFLSGESFELLAPAGNIDCLYAAVSAGADAVYAGADRFSARAYADNFDTEGLKRAINYMHLFGKKLYLTLNTLVKEREYKDICSFVKPLYEEGLDGVIIQDTGAAALLRDEFKGLRLHASTQMSICTGYGANLVKKFGIDRIVPARELSLKEIKRLKEESGLEIECFIHGAMCYSFSGQCLMSSFLGGRSGNRGRCAGTCRLGYSFDNKKDVHILSMKDMCTIDILPELMDAGICSFKIEGRMKPPEYVWAVSSIYRKYMDMYIEGGKESYRVENKDRERLLSIYSRGGISPGYYKKRNGPDMINKDSSGYKSRKEEVILPGRLKKDVEASCVIKQGEPAELTLKADDIVITKTGAVPEAAKTRALDSNAIRKQIMKTGNSDFNIASVDINTDNSSFVPVSSLNELRRQAFEKLYERLNSGYKRSL